MREVLQQVRDFPAFELLPGKGKSGCEQCSIPWRTQNEELPSAIEGRDYPDYWLHLEMTSDAPLRVLDQFLRDTWLECCGHLSAFFIQGREYSPGSRVNAGRILSQGMQFYHRYDFGTMTELTLRVLSQETRVRAPREFACWPGTTLLRFPASSAGPTQRKFAPSAFGTERDSTAANAPHSTRFNRLRAMRCSCRS